MKINLGNKKCLEKAMSMLALTLSEDAIVKDQPIMHAGWQWVVANINEELLLAKISFKEIKIDTDDWAFSAWDIVPHLSFLKTLRQRSIDESWHLTGGERVIISAGTTKPSNSLGYISYNSREQFKQGAKAALTELLYNVEALESSNIDFGE